MGKCDTKKCKGVGVMKINEYACDYVVDDDGKSKGIERQKVVCASCYWKYEGRNYDKRQRFRAAI